jgi:hypothetical protein
MIGFDLDGTLLDSEKRLSEYSREVLTEAIRRGVIVLPATGRVLPAIPKEVMEIPGIRYALTANGGRVLDLKEDKVLHECLVEYESARDVLETLRKYDIMLEVYYENSGYAGEEDLRVIERYIPDPAVASYMRRTRRTVEDPWKFFQEKKCQVDKIQAFFVDQKEKTAALEEIERRHPELRVTRSQMNNLEINGKDADKWIGLKKLAGILGIREEEIMACGDGTNDTEMIRGAGLGIAMANAQDEVKQAADYVTLSNDDDGVAKAIEKFVLQ